MKQNVTMLSITIYGIDCKERSRIFKLISQIGIVGSQILYKPDNTMVCNFPASKNQEIPDSFFDLISNHEGSSLKVESVRIDDEVDVSDDVKLEDTKMDSAEISADAEKNEVELNETETAEEEKEEKGNDNFSEDSDNNSKVTETSNAPVTEVKRNRGQTALPEDFKDEDIEKIFAALKFKQDVKGTLTAEDKIQTFNELVDELAKFLDIRDSSKKETFLKLMKIANKCFERNPEKPVTTRTMKKEGGFSAGDWKKIRSWLGEKVRDHDLTLSSFFEYVFRGVKEYTILLSDSDSIEVSDHDVQPIAENLEESVKFSEVTDENSYQHTIRPILREEKKYEFIAAFKKVMDSDELNGEEKVKEVLAIFDVTDPKAIRLTYESFKYEMPFDWFEIGKDAMISNEDLSNLLLWFSMKLRKSEFFIDGISVERFLSYLKFMIEPYKEKLV